MSDRMALKIAIDLVHLPSHVRLYRSEPLPDDVSTLLRIAAGDDVAEREAAALTDRSRDTVRQAAAFFIEQILFDPNADSYQVLGANSYASASELRRNVAFLLRWLHPDLDPRGERSIFIKRVTSAWNDVKTPARRAAYDDQLRCSKQRNKPRFRSVKLGVAHNLAGKRSRNGHPVRSRSDGNVKVMQVKERINSFRRALLAILRWC